MSRPDFSNPVHIVATGIATGAVLFGLSYVVVALFEGFGILVKAIGAAGGLAVSVATAGFATAGTVSAWLAPVASAGLAAAGVGTSYLVVARIVEKGKEKPYEWLLPALGLLAAFFVDLTKDSLLATEVERAIYALSTGLLTVGGGLLLMQKRILVRTVGFLLPFAPSVVVWLLLLREAHIPRGLGDFIASGSVGAIGLVGVFTLGVLIAVLGILLPNAAPPDR